MASHGPTTVHEHAAGDCCCENEVDRESNSSTASAHLKDSAADFNRLLSAANLKIKLAGAADAAALGTTEGDSKPVVITFLPCCNETKEELSNPLSLVNNPDADAQLLLERIRMQFFIVVDGQHDSAPETSLANHLAKTACYMS